MTEQGLAISSNKGVMPALSMQDAKTRYNALVEYTKTMMTSGKDFGSIPGTGTKPTLLKPGAEKLCSLFGLTPIFDTLKCVEDFEKGLFFYRIKCTLMRGDDVIASGIGSCNSMEKKYRYRWVPEYKASDDEKAKAVDVQERNGQYGPYKMLKIENSEPFDLVNTIDKMAQKRALVAATLIGTNASEFFTQDIEDMSYVEGDYSEVTPEQAKAQPRQTHQTNTASPKPDAGDRPWSADELKAVLEYNASNKGEYYATEKQRNLLAALLSEHFQDDQKRHEASLWLFGAASTNDIDGSMVKVALDWLKPEKDDGGAYVIDASAKTELSSALTAALVAQGQQPLI
jgi:hypothetical protein